jgi:hypothetical protein
MRTGRINANYEKDRPEAVSRESLQTGIHTRVLLNTQQKAPIYSGLEYKISWNISL